MSYRVWYSTESFADYIIDNTDLRDKNCVKKKMYESDANNASLKFGMSHIYKKRDYRILFFDTPV